MENTNIMTKQIKDILRCYAMGMSIRMIGNVFNISRNTVRKYVRQFQDSGMTMEKLQSMPEHHLQELFCNPRERNRKPSTRQMELEALLPEYAARLKRKGVTVKSLHEEYKALHPDGFERANFGVYLRRYTLSTRVIGHVEHYAGDQMYIDYAGDKLEVIDAETGEVKPVEVFVAILPCSHYTYCEACWSQRKEDLIRSCENALHFFGGVPMAIVPDNLKSAVIRSDRNEPIINDEFQSFADHYQCAVYPARVRHPKDKALVENAVKLMYRSVYVSVEGKIFHDIDSLNVAIQEALKVFNSRKLSGRKESRRELFENVEADYLRPLPTVRYHLKERKSMTVLGNSYVTLNKHHYSVPKAYVGKRVDIVYDADVVEIFHGLSLITSHMRDDTPYAYTQKDAHNLPGHPGSYEQDLNEIYRRAGEIDNIVLHYLKDVAAQQKYPPKAFRSCRGILSLEKRFGLDRLVAACACAATKQVYGYQAVLDILNHGDDAAFMAGEDMDNSTTSSLPQNHKNIRGRDYFSTPQSTTFNTNINNGNE